MASQHPRRRPASPCGLSALEESLANLCLLPKGATFHSPPCNSSNLYNPFDTVPRFMPPHSSTCPKDLEDLLIGAGERRAVDLLTRVDRAFQQSSSLGSILSQPEVLPVPSFFVDEVLLDDIPEKRRDSHGHTSDSGLGSSIADPEDDDEQESCARDRRSSRATSSDRVTTDRATTDQNTEGCLSDFAAKQIYRFLVKPILREASLKDFHPLLKDAPQSVGNKKITTLRDLEKTLIFLAPDYSRSPAAYLRFCETSIRCLHATADKVPESSQRLPTDRPYTNQYFSDLITQIRRYAQILAATRAKQAKGEALEDMDVSLDERLEVHGGMTHNGRPAELVRRKGDQIISVATGQVLPSEDATAVSAKRLMADVDDDGARRSMARRKKGELPKTYTCGMDSCDKQFNRPCDLTKHRKTHERPWKCSFSDCKYYTHGWPTEKERDRHVNDRHSDAPTMYKCQWQTSGCPYESKRESNCKSHMEKAHGWIYVRSKSTKTSKAKGKAKVPVVRLSPSLSLDATPAPSTSTSPFELSVHSLSGSPQTPYMPLNAGAGVEADPVDSPMANAPFICGPEFTGHFNFDGMVTNNFGSTNLTPGYYAYTPSLSDDRRASHNISTAGTTPLSAPLGYNSFEDAMAPFTPEDMELLMNSNPKDMQSSAAFQATSGYDCIGGSTMMPNAWSPYVQQGSLNDLTFSVPATLAVTNQGFGGEYSGNDFTLYDANANYHEPLFDDQAGLGSLSSQLGELSSDIQSTERNVYAEFFPELDN